MKVMSNTLMQTYSSQMDMLNNLNNEEMYEDRDRNQWGNAREYVERCEKRMKERINTIEKRYTLNLEELEKTIEEKDMVIQLRNYKIMQFVRPYNRSSRQFRTCKEIMRWLSPAVA